jgi:NAD(P)H-dependent FMN reductase
MITVISGTNRDNNTKRVSRFYQRILSESGVENQLLSLDEADVYRRDEAFKQMEERFLKAADKFIIVMPEYNGSYPGILKLMIDNTDVSKTWWHKKVALTGVATGRAGNLRGMEHLTGALLHMKMLVHPNRLPISIVDKLMDAQGDFHDQRTIAAIRTQIDEFLNF